MSWCRALRGVVSTRSPTPGATRPRTWTRRRCCRAQPPAGGRPPIATRTSKGGLPTGSGRVPAADRVQYDFTAERVNERMGRLLVARPDAALKTALAEDP